MRRLYKLFVFAFILVLSVGYATINITLNVKGIASVGPDLSDHDVYLGNLYINNINKFSSINEDMKTINIEIENGKSTIEYYVVNNTNQYKTSAGVICPSMTGITINDTNVEVEPQNVGKGTLTVNNTTGSNKSITCVLENELETYDKIIENKKIVLFSLDGYELETAYKIIDGYEYGELPSKTTTGYVVDKWKDQLGQEVTPTSRINIIDDEILYGVVKAKTYEVMLDTNYGETSLAKLEVTYKEAYGELPMPTRNTNYSFEGWYTSASGGTKISSTDIYEETTNKTLYAHWNYLCTSQAGQVWNFDYNGTNGSDGSEQTFTTPCEGIYKLEVWGASGGYGYDSERKTGNGGYGGYSTGEILLIKGKNLSITVGGAGESNCQTTNCKGGYNGGSQSNKWAFETGAGFYTGGGGGATNIAEYKNLGELKNYINNKDSVYIVAGGGGGGDYYPDWGSAASGGSGGGYEGGDALTGSDYSSNSIVSGKQNSGYGFGLAGTTYVNDSTGGSGGGWYGGTSSLQHYSGAGGSGYIGFNELTNKVMYCYKCRTSSVISTKTETTTCTNSTATPNCAKEGHGYARITLVSID